MGGIINCGWEARLFNVRQAIDQQEISSFFDLVED